MHVFSCRIALLAGHASAEQYLAAEGGLAQSVTSHISTGMMQKYMNSVINNFFG